MASNGRVPVVSRELCNVVRDFWKMANTGIMREELGGLLVQIGQDHHALNCACSEDLEHRVYERSHFAPVDTVYVPVQHVHDRETSIVSGGLENGTVYVVPPTAATNRHG